MFAERMEKRLKQIQNTIPNISNLMSREDINIRKKRSRDEAPTPIKDNLINNQSLSARFLNPGNPSRPKQPSMTNEHINIEGQ